MSVHTQQIFHYHWWLKTIFAGKNYFSRSGFNPRKSFFHWLAKTCQPCFHTLLLQHQQTSLSATSTVVGQTKKATQYYEILR